MNVYEGHVSLGNWRSIGGYGIKFHGSGARYWDQPHYNIGNNEHGNDWPTITSTFHNSRKRLTIKQQELVLRLLCAARDFVLQEYKQAITKIFDENKRIKNAEINEKVELALEILSALSSDDFSKINRNHKDVLATLHGILSIKLERLGK